MRHHFFRSVFLDCLRIRSQTTRSSHAFVCDLQAEYGDLLEERRLKAEAQVSINADADKCVTIAEHLPDARDIGCSRRAEGDAGQAHGSATDTGGRAGRDQLKDGLALVSTGLQF